MEKFVARVLKKEARPRRERRIVGCCVAFEKKTISFKVTQLTMMWVCASAKGMRMSFFCVGLEAEIPCLFFSSVLQRKPSKSSNLYKEKSRTRLVFLSRSSGIEIEKTPQPDDQSSIHLAHEASSVNCAEQHHDGSRKWPSSFARVSNA